MEDARPIAVVFGDIRGFTSYTASRGDRQAYRLARTFIGIAEDEVSRHQGRVVKTYGDGVMTSFAEAGPAVRCAIAMQENLRAHNGAQPDESFCVGIGLAWGEALRTEDDDLFGHTVNLAKRLSDVAKGCQVVGAQAVVDRVPSGDGIRYRDLGLRDLEGIGRERLYEIVWRRETRRLESEDGAVDLVLTDEGKLVMELSKTALGTLKEADQKLSELAARGGLAGGIGRLVRKRVGGALNEALTGSLADSGLGVEHDLEKIEAKLSSEGIVLRIAGGHPLRPLRVPQGEAREFIEALERMRGASEAG